MNKNGRKTLATLAALAVALAIVNASVFVYYPITINLAPVAPPIILDKGSNAGGPDLYGNTIDVVIKTSSDPTNTSATITVHPTYQTTYYKNILQIKNQDTRVYYVKIYVVNAFTNAKITEAKLIIGTNTIDLKSTGIQPAGWITISGGATLTVDLKIVIDTSGGSYNTPPFTSDSATIKLVYSPQSSESPPQI